MKYCKCEQKVGDSTKTCPHCKYSFKESDKFLSKEQKILQKYAARVGAKKGDLVLHTPRGPFDELPAFQPNENWVYEVVEYYLTKNILLLPEGIFYIGLKFTEPGSSDRESLVKLISEFSIEFNNINSGIYNDYTKEI